MYSIYADDICIFDDALVDIDDNSLVNAKLKMSDNSAGTLTFKMPITNPGYNTISALNSTITVKYESNVIFEGRIISGTIDFFNNKNITVEGALAYLNDSIQPQKDLTKKKVNEYLGELLKVHNEKVPAKRRILLGNVTVVDSTFSSGYFYTDFKSTMDTIQDTLVENLGGHLEIRYENGNRYLDYLADWHEVRQRPIKFGQNLLDLSKEFDENEYCTVLIPLGASTGQNTETGLEEYLTVESVNQGSMYLVNQEAVTNHGRIERVSVWNDIDDPQLLYMLGQLYLQSEQYNNLVLDVQAIDLSYIMKNREYYELGLYDQVRVISEPHGLNKVFPITEIEIDFNDPSNNSYILGNEDGEDPSLTANTRSENAALAEQMNQLKQTNHIEYYQYINKNAHNGLDDRDHQMICAIRFATKEASIVVWQAEIQIDIEPYTTGGEAEVELTYKLNGVEMEYHPTDKFTAGKHIISVFRTLDVESLTSYSWNVYLKVKNGTGDIGIGDIHAVIWGDKLVSQYKWTGYIDLEDKFNVIPITDENLPVVTFHDSKTIGTQKPIPGDGIEQEFGVIPLNYENTPVVSYEADVAFNKEIAKLYLWRELAAYSWDATDTGFIWG